MFRRVLVVLDNAPLSERIVPWVRRLLAPIGGDLRLLAVLPLERAVTTQGRTVAFAAQREDAARLTCLLGLEMIAARLRDDGMDVTSEVRFGDALEAALDAMQDWGAEMIAVADRPEGGWRRLLPRLVDELVKQSPVPVLVSMRTGQRVA